MTRKTIFKLAALCCLALPARAADAPFLGNYDPEKACEGPVSNPVCAYKTWFYCRATDDNDMCLLVLGKGRDLSEQEGPWSVPLSELMQGPLDLPGYAFVGSQKVTADRLGKNQTKLSRLIGSTEIMDTYGDPNDPRIAYISSEFYAEVRPGRWRLVGWALNIDGGQSDTACAERANRDQLACQIYVEGLPTWADLMRAGKIK